MSNLWFVLQVSTGDALHFGWADVVRLSATFLTILGPAAGFIYWLFRRTVTRLEEELTKAKISRDTAEDGYNRTRRELDGAIEKITSLTIASEQLGNSIESQKAENERVAVLLKRRNAEKLVLKEKADRIDRVVSAITEDERELWKKYPAVPFAEYSQRMALSQTRVLTVGNLKGGVGKTTIALNLAADIVGRVERRVLLIDLDHQGSSSRALAAASAQPTQFASASDAILRNEADQLWFANTRKRFPGLLDRVDLLPAGLSLGATETQSLMRWLLDEGSDENADTDLRYRLAEFLLSDCIQNEYDIVIIDTGPRLSPGAINALCASHGLIVPVGLDSMGAGTVGAYLGQVARLKQDLFLQIENIGVVANMSPQQIPTRQSELALKELDADLLQSPVRAWRYRQILPRTTKLSNHAGRDIAYLKESTLRSLFAEIGKETIEKFGIPDADRRVA